jgi:hypothetical protein
MKKALADHRINFVCTAQFYEALVARAKVEGLPLSEVIRRFLAAGLKRKVT